MNLAREEPFIRPLAGRLMIEEIAEAELGVGAGDFPSMLS